MVECGGGANLFKLTAYKDEYEVARLLTSADFLNEAKRQVPGGQGLTYKLHPPALRAMGRKNKVSFGPRSHASLKMLARMKLVRGTPFDVFGYAHVRRIERGILSHYRTLVQTMAQSLSVASYERAVTIASLPDGFVATSRSSSRALSPTGLRSRPTALTCEASRSSEPRVAQRLIDQAPAGNQSMRF